MGRTYAATLVVLVAALAGCGGGGSEDEIEVVPAPPPAPLTLAVIGDTPYGEEQEAAFPGLVDAIDRDGDVDLVLHVGDIKTGGSSCDAERYRRLRRLFESFASPFVYTPGDNEWTDCYRPQAGGHDPADSLALVRRTFYPKPGRSLGERPIRVESQSAQQGFEPFVENVLWTRQQVVFSTVHVTGSDNGRGLPGGRRSFERRTASALAWLDRTFRRAASADAKGVVVALHADMFAGTPRPAFAPIIARLEELAAAFDGPVLLLNGDSHSYRRDRPFEDAPNLTRIVVEGETTDEWLRVDIDPDDAEVFATDRRRGR
jgi:hypothetical protein